MAWVPSFVSEFPDASLVADCVPAAGLMLTNKVTHNKYPATVDEREALQAVMPDPTPDSKPGTEDEGANASQLAGGLLARYGLRTAPNTGGWPAIASALADPTKGVVIFGLYPKLPATLRNQGRQPTFAGGHAIYAQAGLIGDPLGTHMIAAKASDLQAFAETWGGMAIIAAEAPAVFVGHKLRIPAAGTYTFWKVARFTHKLYAPRPVLFSRASSAPVKHGAPGFWLITAGGLTGYYAVTGRSGAFQIVAVYSDGHQEPVNPAS